MASVLLSSDSNIRNIGKRIKIYRKTNLKHYNVAHLLLSKEGDTALVGSTFQNPKEKLQAIVSLGPLDILHHRPFAYIMKQ